MAFLTGSCAWILQWNYERAIRRTLNTSEDGSRNCSPSSGVCCIQPAVRLSWSRFETHFSRASFYYPYCFIALNGSVIFALFFSQIENEYGSYHAYACDMQYRLDLRDLTRSILGPDVLLYTTDGYYSSQAISCGRVEGALTTVDFGVWEDISRVMQLFRESVPVGPFFNR